MRHNGSIVYYDGQTNDSRMNCELALTAAAAGARLFNHVEVTSLLKDDSGRVCGVRARDVLREQEFEVRARVVINATGPAADELRLMDEQDLAYLNTRAQEEQFHRAATRALAHGGYDEARELQRHVTPLAKLVTSIHGIPGLKAALSLIGYVGGRPRLPLEPVGDDVVAHIRRQIDLLSGETHL